MDIFFFVERLLVFASPLSFSLATFLALSAGARRTGFVSRRASALVESVSSGGSFSGFRSGVTTLLDARAFGYENACASYLPPRDTKRRYLVENDAAATRARRRAADAFVRRREERAWRRRKPPEGNRKFRRRWRPETFVL